MEFPFSAKRKSGSIAILSMIFFRPSQTSKKVFPNKGREKLIKGIFPQKNSSAKITL
jgi:hypothetical protein